MAAVIVVPVLVNGQPKGVRGALSRATESGQLRLRYRPIAPSPDQRVLAAEALLRWWLDSGRLLKPGQFVELAEEMGRWDAAGDPTL